LIEKCINCGAGVAWGPVFSMHEYERMGKRRRCPRCFNDFDVSNPVDDEGNLDLGMFMRGRIRDSA